MALFISVDNQNLLYDMINKTSEIHTVFSNVQEKNAWFKKMIENQYQQLPQNITREVLLATNRKVLTTMVEQLRLAQSSRSISQSINTLKRDNTPNIDQIQLQYKSMFDIQKPKEIDFSEKLDDDVITNMDELIEQQKKMRERELQDYLPSPPSGPSKINILEDLPKEVLKPIGERRVQFDIPTSLPAGSSSDFSEEINKKIDRLEDKLDKFITFFLEKFVDRPEEVIRPEKEQEQENTTENITILKQLINQEY